MLVLLDFLGEGFDLNFECFVVGRAFGVVVVGFGFVLLDFLDFFLDVGDGFLDFF